MSMKKQARISDCGTYRYWLSRTDTTPKSLGFPNMAFVMLNPSIADHELDDPTIRRCMGFAEDNGFHGITVMNLFALRATNPAELKGHPDPVGPENNEHLAALVKAYPKVVCAWGASADPQRVADAVKIMKASNPDVKLLCFGTTKDGSPCHPLYLKRDSLLRQWVPNI